MDIFPRISEDQQGNWHSSQKSGHMALGPSALRNMTNQNLSGIASAPVLLAWVTTSCKWTPTSYCCVIHTSTSNPRLWQNTRRDVMTLSKGICLHVVQHLVLNKSNTESCMRSYMVPIVAMAFASRCCAKEMETEAPISGGTTFKTQTRMGRSCGPYLRFQTAS